MTDTYRTSFTADKQQVKSVINDKKCNKRSTKEKHLGYKGSPPGENVTCVLEKLEKYR